MILCMALIDSEEEKKKFELLYTKYRNLAFYIAKGVLGDEDLAEDAVQEAYLALATHIHQVGDPAGSSAKYFLTTIVKNKSLDILRREKHKGEAMDEEVLEQLPGSFDPLDRYLVAEKIGQIAACLRKLDQNSRVVLEYKYLHQMKEKEIAQLLDISPKTANMRIFRARNKLAQILSEEGLSYD